MRAAAATKSSGRGAPGIKPKDLVGIPWESALALRNDGWYLRQDIIWHKVNPMPESVDDRPTTAHEYLFLLSKSPRYFYDASAIMEPATGGAHSRGHGQNPKMVGRINMPTDNPGSRARKMDKSTDRRKAGFQERWNVKQNASFQAAINGLVEMRNKRSVWSIVSEPYRDAHYATFPTALVEPCVKAGSKEGDTILDPFSGSGTVGQVCVELGRHFVGIDLDRRSVRLAKKRIDQVAPLFVRADIL